MKKYDMDREKRKELLEEIKEYFLEERDEELGDLAVGLMLDFFLERLGPPLYNQGIIDAHSYMSERTDDLFSLLQ